MKVFNRVFVCLAVLGYAGCDPEYQFRFQTSPAACLEYEANTLDDDQASSEENGPEDRLNAGCGFPDLRQPVQFTVYDEYVGAHVKAGIAGIVEDPGPAQILYDDEGNISYLSATSWGQLFARTGGPFEVIIGWEHGCNDKFRKCEVHTHSVDIAPSAILSGDISLYPVRDYGAFLIEDRDNGVYLNRDGRVKTLDEIAFSVQGTLPVNLHVGESEHGIVLLEDRRTLMYLDYDTRDQDYSWKKKTESIPAFSQFIYVRGAVWTLTDQNTLTQHSDTEVVDKSLPGFLAKDVAWLRAGTSGGWLQIERSVVPAAETCSTEMADFDFISIHSGESWGVRLPATARTWMQGTYEQPEIQAVYTGCDGLRKIQRMALYPDGTTEVLSVRSGRTLLLDQHGLDFTVSDYKAEPDIATIRMGRTSVWWDEDVAVIMDTEKSFHHWEFTERGSQID